MAELYKGKSHGSRTGSEIIGEGRHPRKGNETPVIKAEVVPPKKATVPKSGVHLKRGDYNG